MDRRTLLVSAAALAAAGKAGAAGYGLRDAAREAFLYTLPLNEIANVRQRSLSFGGKPNTFIPQRTLADPTSRTVTTPNNDTIYASAFIDLTQGPAMLTLPDLGDRYASFALMDIWSDNIAVLGTRTTGPRGGTFTLVGPSGLAPPDAIRSPTPWVWALARVLVSGPADLPAAQAVQAAYRVQGSPLGPKPAPSAKRDGPWVDYFRAASALLVETPPPATDTGLLRRIAPLGLGADFDPSRFTPNQQAEITAGVAEALALVRNAKLGMKDEGGWIYQAADTGAFFQDYAYRARVAVSGLAALPNAEAMYLLALSPEGQPKFDGEGLWRLRFAKDGAPPVNAFWSLTMYEATADGQFFLTENPIKRYAIGDRTPGLVANRDGSLDLWISRTDPGGARTANWLPAPAKGPFALFLRFYLPKPEAISRAYVPPRLEKILH